MARRFESSTRGDGLWVVSRFDHLIERPSRTQSRRAVTVRRSSVTAEVVASEWRPAPLGRLGRRLIADVERYLEFYAIARG